MAKARTLTLKTKVEVTGLDKLDNLGKQLQTTGRNLTVGVTLPLVAAGGALVAMAEEAARADAELNRAFESMGAAAWTSVDALKAQQQELQNLTTFGDEDISHLQSVLLTFGNVTGESFDRATEAALDMSAMLGTDLQSSAVQLGKALNDPIKGLSALSRVGVSFTKEQQDQIKVLAESGRVMEAQGIILGELERQFGGAAEAMAGTAGGQMQQAMNALGDAGEEFGAIIAPVLRDVANGLKEFAKWLRELNPETKEWVVRIAALAAALGPLLVVVGSVVRVFSAVISLAPKIGAAFTLMTGPIGIAVAGVGALATAFATDFLGVRSRFEKDMADIGEFVGNAGDAIRDFLGIVEEEVPQAARVYSDAQIEMLNSTENAWSSMHSIYDQEINAITGAVEAGVDGMADEMGEAPGKMADELLAAQFRLTDATAQLVAFMEQAISPAQEMMELQGFLASNELAQGLASNNPLISQKSAEMRDAALSRLAELQGQAFTYGNNVGTSFAQGMNAAYGWVVDAAGNLAAAARNQIGINSEPPDPRSPLHGITKWGGNIAKTLAAGMTSGISTVQGAASRLAGAAVIGSTVGVAAASPAAGGGGGMTVNNFYLQWDGEPPRGRDESEIVANLQRLSPLIDGRLATVR